MVLLPLPQKYFSFLANFVAALKALSSWQCHGSRRQRREAPLVPLPSPHTPAKPDQGSLLRKCYLELEFIAPSAHGMI